MYLEDKIFGSLTFKQFSVVAVASAVVYYAAPLLAAPFHYVVAGVTVIAAVVTVYRLKPVKIPLDQLQQYLESERGRVGKDRFAAKMQKRAAELQSQIYARKQKGQESDLEMEQVLKIVETFLV